MRSNRRYHPRVKNPKPLGYRFTDVVVRRVDGEVVAEANAHLPGPLGLAGPVGAHLPKGAGWTALVVPERDYGNLAALAFARWLDFHAPEAP